MQDTSKQPLKLTVFAVGGGGTNIAKSIKKLNKGKSINFITIDTEGNRKSSIGTRIIIQDPSDMKPQPAVYLQIQQKIKPFLKDTEVAIIIATLGGITGTYVTPLLLNVLRRDNIQTFCIVTTPFAFENRKEKALAAVERIKESGTAFTIYDNEFAQKEYGDAPAADVFYGIDCNISNTISDIYAKEDWIIECLKEGGEM